MVRALDTATQSTGRDRSRLVPRTFVTVTCQDGTTFGFWDDAETVTTNVLSGETGLSVSRTFVGDGAITGQDTLPLTIGLNVRTWSISFSHIHATVQLMARGHDLRLAKVEVHRGYLSPDTMLLVATPRVRFMGQVNGAPIETPAAGGEGSITLNCVSHTRELTKTNTALRSDESQKRRSGDRFRRYTGVAILWPIFWGETESKD